MKKLKKGFTIVELVIVIAVIGILSAVLIPTFANLIGNAKEARAQAEVSNAYTAYLEAHAADDEYLAQSNVYFCKDATVTATSEVYHYENGEWKKVETVVPAEYDRAGDPDYDAFNGYYLYE